MGQHLISWCWGDGLGVLMNCASGHSYHTTKQVYQYLYIYPTVMFVTKSYYRTQPCLCWISFQTIWVVLGRVRSTLCLISNRNWKEKARLLPQYTYIWYTYININVTISWVWEKWLLVKKVCDIECVWYAVVLKQKSCFWSY